jgi:hypothetical protein
MDNFTSQVQNKHLNKKSKSERKRTRTNERFKQEEAEDNYRRRH